MIELGVNIDHIATVRQARKTVEPDPVWAAALAELGGADCITIHLREDRRHIQDRDVHLLRFECGKGGIGECLNLELPESNLGFGRAGAPQHNFLAAQIDATCCSRRTSFRTVGCLTNFLPMPKLSHRPPKYSKLKKLRRCLSER